MGVLDSVRGVYFSMEDRYYAFLDSLDARGIPVYKAVDPIDSVVPSFPLFVLVILLLLGLAIVFLLAPLLSFGNPTLTVRVVDFDDNPIAGARVGVELGTTELVGTTDISGKAAFSVPANSSVIIRVTRDGYDDFESTAIDVPQSKEFVARIQVMGGSGGAITRTIRILNQAGQPLLGQLVSLSFTCLNPNATAPSAVTTTTGQAVVREPVDCGGLVARISAQNFREIASQPITNEIQTVYLQSSLEPGDGEQGSAEVRVTFEGETVEDTIRIGLYAGDSDILVDSEDTENGKAVFTDIPFGHYRVKNNATSQFGVSTQTVQVGETRAVVELELERNVAGRIRIKVADNVSNAVISGASVSLRRGNDEVERKVSSSDNNGYLEFFVGEDVSYNAAVSAPEYCFEERQDLRINPGSYIIKLRPFTAECGGVLRVKVVDQEGKPVSNAQVALGTEQQFFIGTAQQLSDLNGVARFSGMRSGTYTAFAAKGSSSGWSDPNYFSRKKGEPEQVDLVTTLLIPNGILRLHMVDKEGEPVPFAEVEFIDVFDQKPFGGGAKPADGNGVAELETRADKTVYAVVKKTGFASVSTPLIEIKPAVIQEFTIEMLPMVTKFEVELLGLYQGNLHTLPATNPNASVAAGQEYVARFRIKVPQEHVNGNKTFRELGIHIRTGTEQIMEKDLWLVKEFNPPAASIVRATRFSGNYNLDIASVTNADAKWVNSVWSKPVASVMTVEAVVKVKENAALGKKLDLYYRVWGKNGGVLRDPEDQSIDAQELYADAHVASFQVGTGTLCDDRFCFDASIYDQTEALRMPVTGPFPVKNFQDYTLSFTIANTSARDTDTFQHAELRVANPEENLSLREYTIFDASSEGSRPVIGTANAYLLPRIEIGDLSPGRKVSGEIAFLPQKSGSGTLDFKVVDTDLGMIVFNKQLEIVTVADKDFVIIVEPAELASGVENDIVVSLLDKETGLPVPDAIIRIKDKFANVLVVATSNSLGNAEIHLPAQAPGVILDVEAERSEYNTAVKKITIGTDILGFSPDTVGFSVNPNTQESDAKTLKLSNLAPFDLFIESVSLEGRFYGLIDSEATNNQLMFWQGTKIQKEDFTEVPIEVHVSPEAKNLEALQNLEGNVRVQVGALGQSWEFLVPAKVTVGLGGETDDPACLTLSQTKWETSTQGKPLTLEFEIQNNCAINGEPVAVQDLESKILWSTNQTGEFLLLTDESQSVLRSGYFLTIAPSVPRAGSVHAKLVFTPNANVAGDAKATVLFQATNPTDSAPQTLSAQLEVDIAVVNLLSCVSYDKDFLEMKAEETFTPKTTAFGESISTGTPPTGRQTLANEGTPETETQNTSPPSNGTAPPTRAPPTSPLGTGSQDVFVISTGDCGGQTQFVVESDLSATPKRFSLADNTSQRITVQSGDAVPGQYGVRVSLQGAGAKVARQVKTIPVLVRPSLDECILLSKFEFNVFKDPAVEGSGVDTARVLNQCYNKPVQVFIDRHSLNDAMSDGQKWAAIGMVMGMLGSVTQNPGVLGGYNGNNPGGQSSGNPNGLPSGYKSLGQQAVENSDGSVSFSEIIQGPDGTKYKWENQSKTKLVPLKPKTGPTTGTTGETTVLQTDPAKPAVPVAPSTTPVASTTSTGNPSNSSLSAEARTQLEAERSRLGTRNQTLEQGIVNLNGYLTNPQYSNQLESVHEQIRYSTDELEVNKERITQIDVQLGQPASSTAFPRQLLLPWTGLQSLPFFGNAQSNDDTALQDCTSGAGFEEKVLKDRQDDEEQVQLLQSLPIMSMMFGGGNTNNPFSQALMMFAMGTAQAYNSQTDICIATIQRDVQLGSQSTFGSLLEPILGDSILEGSSLLDLSSFFTGNEAKGVYKLLDASGQDDLEFEGMSIEEYRKPVLSNRTDNSELSIETRFIRLSNDDGLVQQDALNPLFAVLSINGRRHVYKPNQIYESEKPNKLEEEKSQPVSSKFHLQLNSYEPNFDVEVSPEIGNCQIGQTIGSTGENAVPRILLDWSWNAIAQNACDADNSDYVYCDSVQFSIALLKKLQVLREFTEANAETFECPATISGIEPARQSLSATGLDLGVTLVEINRVGTDANIVSTVENSNNLSATVQLTTVVTNIVSNTAVKTCVQNVSVISKSQAGCLAEDLPPGEYRVVSSVSNISCSGCENARTANDSLEKTFPLGFEGVLTKCEPVSTLRLEEFIIATEQAGKSLSYPSGFDREKIVKLTHFNAHLMADGYGNDFRNDFQNFALTRAFFQTPSFYSEPDGLGEFFSNTEKMRFEYFNGPTRPLPKPGLYAVDLDVAFADTQMEWFADSTPRADIVVSLEQTADARPASPFYYYPLDGIVGRESSRIGYGTNFELSTPDAPVQLNNNTDQLILAQDIAGSIPAATLSAGQVRAFSVLNTQDRGLVLSVDSQANELLLAPSLATPVLLKVNAQASNDAFAFYSVEVDSQPQANLPFLSRWSGISPSCRDFLGDGLDRIAETPDVSGINAKCGVLGARENVSYGFEWCNRTLPGSVTLQTVFFTPAHSTAVLSLTGANESAEFLGLQGDGQRVELSGVPGMPRNSPSNFIESVEDVFELVAQEKVCVTGSDNGVRTEFFWNPKPILENLLEERGNAMRVCIGATSATAPPANPGTNR